MLLPIVRNKLFQMTCPRNRRSILAVCSPAFVNSKIVCILLLTVKHCDGVGKIQNLHSISQKWENSPTYYATCDEGFEQFERHQTFECQNQQWSPTLRCVQRTGDNFMDTISKNRGKDWL